MRIYITLLFISFISTFYSFSDTVKNSVSWSQMSLFPDSNLYNIFLGGPGSVRRSLKFSKDKLSIFNKHYMFFSEQEDIYFVNSNIPIVDAQYILGNESEQNLSLYFSQSVSNRSGYAVSFLKRSHDGYYSNQSTNNNYFQFSFNNKSRDSTYNMKFGLKNQRLYNQLNGGLTNDSNFVNSNDFESNRKILNVNMQNSYATNRLLKSYLNQNWILNSSKNDSTILTIKKISFNNSFQRRTRVYYDSLNPDLFLNNFYSTESTHDSILLDVFNSSIKYSIISNKDSIVQNFNFGLDSEILSYKNKLTDTILINQSVSLDFNKSKRNNSFRLGGNFYPLGYKKNNYEINFLYESFNLKDKKLKISADLTEFRPVFEINNYQSNHHFWDNKKFNNILFWNASAEISTDLFSLKSQINQAYRPIYFTEYSEPSQFDSSLQVIQSSLNYNLIKKKYNLFAEIVYQYQGGAQIFQLPDWVGQVKFNYIFGNEKSNLKLSLGVNAKVFSSYALPGYSSEINQFTISNERIQPSYFIVDFLAKTQIKSVTVFLMVTHLNSGLTGFDYFSAFHFPIADRCLKFGLRWVFLD
jgi:hypothetical protein